LLRLTLPLVRTHSFTREALSRSVLSLPKPHTQPLNETAVTALFGSGDDARRTLMHAWLEQGRAEMKNAPSTSLKDILRHRLRYNEPVLHLLPEVIAVY
jgi:ubiquinone biosynthesis protein COQ9